MWYLAYQSGTSDFSKLSLLSWPFNLFSWCWYLLSLYISSAFCLLKEQHMPRSVGILENMLEQLNRLPFHQHFFIMPVMIRWDCNTSKELRGLALTMVLVCFGSNIDYIKARQLWVPKQFKQVRIALVQVHTFVSLSVIYSGTWIIQNYN